MHPRVRPMPRHTLIHALHVPIARVQSLAASLADDRKGVAALELALLAPVLLLLLMGIFDVGQLTYTDMQVNAAANAGAQYVYSNGCASTQGIATAVTSATILSVTANPSPVCPVYYCATNGALVSSTSGATCPSGEKAGAYATVSAQAAFTPVAPWSGLVLPTTLSASSAIRYQ